MSRPHKCGGSDITGRFENHTINITLRTPRQEHPSPHPTGEGAKAVVPIEALRKVAERGKESALRKTLSYLRIESIFIFFLHLAHREERPGKHSQRSGPPPRRGGSPGGQPRAAGAPRCSHL